MWRTLCLVSSGHWPTCSPLSFFWNGLSHVQPGQSGGSSEAGSRDLGFHSGGFLIQLLAADKAAAGMIGYYAYGLPQDISAAAGWAVITGALYPALGMAGQLIVTLYSAFII